MHPRVLIIEYNDGMKGAILMLNEYIIRGWTYVAKANGEMVATEFVLSGNVQAFHFSYLTLNI